MKLDEYASLDAVGLRELIRSGAVSGAEVEEVARRALELADADLNALTMPPFEPALNHELDGPLAGVPFVIKDSGPFARGVPFALGSRSIRGAVAPVDHDLMSMLPTFGWSGELAEDPVRQLGPGLRRPLVEVLVGQAGTGQAGVRVDPQEGTRTPEVPERPG